MFSEFLAQPGTVPILTALAAGSIVWFVASLSFSRESGILWAPANMVRTILAMSSPDAPWFLLEQAKLLGSTVFRLNLPLPGGLYVVGDGSLARKILKDPSSDKPDVYRKGAVVVGGPSIFNLSSKSPHWKVARKTTSPAFSSKEIHRMNQICKGHVDRWIQETLEPLIVSGGTFDPGTEMIKLTFRVICESAFEYLATDKEIEDFVHNLDLTLKEFVMKQLNNPFREFYSFMLPEWYRAHAAAKKTQLFAQKMIGSYRQRKTRGEVSSDNTVIRLIVESPNFSEQARISDILTFIIAGHDTTGYTLSSALEFLAERPDIAKTLQTELRERPEEQWGRSNYLNCVVQEVHRYFPVAALGAARSLDHDLTFQMDGKQMVIPKGSDIILAFILIHRDEKVYANPDVFDPCRWTNASAEMRENLMPFALGNRNCIGQSLATAEIQTVLPRLIHDYHFEIVEKGRPEAFLTMKLSGCVLRPKKGAIQPAKKVVMDRE